MADWDTVKGVTITDATPTGAGGGYLNANFTQLRDEAPFNSSSDPGSGDDSTEGFFVGSQWFNTTSYVMWACVDATATAAVWRTLYTRVSGALILCPGGDGSVQTGNLQLSGNTLSVTNTNGALILVPNGTGAIQAGSGGNARGSRAVDLQITRSTDTMVASGYYSVIAGGQSNTASGSNTFVGSGFNNTASANYAVVAGGRSNTASTNAYAGVFGGQSNTASGKYGFVANGYGNTASGSYSVVHQGKSSSATGAHSSASGLQCKAGGAANAAYTSILGGNTNWAGAVGATVAGGVAQNTNAAASVNQTTGAVTGTVTEVVAGKFSTIAGGQKNTASGANSTIGGGRQNTASSPYAIVGGGYLNSASDSFSVIGGGNLNTASSEYACVGSGYKNTASGLVSFVGGGEYNTSAGIASSIVCGEGNSSIGRCAFIGGGENNYASGYESCIGGGKHNSASGTYSFVGGGFYALANKWGQQAQAAGKFSAGGDAQVAECVLRCQTTDATANIEMFLDGSSARMTLANNTSWTFNIYITGRRTDAGGEQSAAYNIVGLIAKDATAASTSLKGSTKTVIHEDDATWDVVISADTTNGALKLAVTGAASKTIQWVAFVRTIETTG